MALFYADRVKETSSTTGTGTFDLDGASPGFQSFVAGVGNTNTCVYAIEHPANAWEIGIGTVTSGSPDTLSRDTVLASSNGGSLVNFSSGNKFVFCSNSASRMNLFESLVDVIDAVEVSSAVNKLQISNASTGTGPIIEVTGTDTDIDLVLTPKNNGIVDVTGNLTSSGTVSATTLSATTISATTVTGTLSTAAQPNITSVGTLTSLDVDNININGNTISSTAGIDLFITPLAGQQLILDGTISIDAGVVTGATSITSTTFIGSLTGNADTATASSASTLSNETVDTTNFVTFANTATGDQSLKTNTSLTFDASTATLSTTTLSATTLTGTLSTASQTNITDVGTLNSLDVDNININGNTISSTAGTDLLITPLAGQQIVLDGTIIVDAGVVTGATSITSTAFIGALTGNADTATASSSSTLANETVDATNFVTFANTATGDQALKTNASLTFDATTATLASTNLSATSIAGTLSTAAQTNITSVGTLTSLDIDNINIDGNTISSTAGTDLFITPLAGQQLILDGTIEIDAGVVTGATSITSTAFVGALTGNADTATVATNVTLSNEAVDTTNFITFANTATGDLAIKTNTNLTFDASTATLSATTVSATTLTGTLSTAAQTNITSLGTLTSLDVDNINIDGNTISSTAGTDLFVTPLAGQQLILDNTIIIDAGVVTGATSITSTAFVGALTGNADTATASSTSTLANEAADSSNFIVFANTATGDQALKTNASLTYDATTGDLISTTFDGRDVSVDGTALDLINAVATWTDAPSAVNNIEFGNAATGDDPFIQVIGTDSDIDLNVYAKNAGQIRAFNDVTIHGDLTVLGSQTTIDTETLQVTDNFIVVNNGEAGAGVTSGSAGLEIERGSLTNYYFEFRESDDTFRVGEIGSTQAVASREDTPIDTAVPYWDNTTSSFLTDSGMTYNAATDTLTVTNITGTVSSSGNAASLTLASDTTDSTNFITFANDATGDQALKTNASLTFDATTATLSSTTVSATTLTGTLSTAAQTNVTSLGTLTALDVDNININGNTISSTAGIDLFITPLAGQQLILDGTIEIDAGVVTGATSITSTAFIGALTGNADSATVSTTSTLSNEAADTTNFITFANTATGDQALKTNASLTFDASTVTLSATTLSATTLTGTLSTAAQTNITSVGTLTSLDVDNINIDGNTISSTAGVDLLITPLAGQQIVLDSTIVIDAGVVTGATSITSTAFVGALTGNADTATASSSSTLADESVDTTNFITFANDATGNQAIKTNTNLTFDASSATLSSTTVSATTVSATTLTGTLSTAAQTNVTSLGTLTGLDVDNININGNTISSTAGTDLLITPLAGQQLILDGTIEIDAGVVTGATSITSTAFVGALTGNADTATASSTSTLANETVDTTNFVTFANTATGDQALKTNASLTFDASTATLSSTTVSATTLTGTLSTAAQTNITSLGTLTGLDVNNININGNTISSTGGTDLFITPLAGQQLILDGTIEIDAGVVTGATSITSTAFVGALTGNADTATAASTVTLANDITDTTNSLVFANTATGNQALKTNSNLAFDASTGQLTTASIVPVADSTHDLGTNSVRWANVYADNLTATTITGAISQITVADESSDTTNFLVFTNSATGNQAPKTGTNLTFDAVDGVLSTTAIVAGSATGGTQGSGSINAESLFINGEAVPTTNEVIALIMALS